MKRFLLLTALGAATATLLAPVSAFALRIAPNPGEMAPANPMQQTTQATMAVTGKVIEIEKDPVECEPFKGAAKEQKIPYKIAVIKIESSLFGAKGLTQIRVGFSENQGGGRPIRPGIRPLPAVPGGAPRPQLDRAAPAIGFLPAQNLTLNQEGAFFLQQHPVGDFYVLSFGGAWDKKDKAFDKNIEEVKSYAKIIDNPIEALKDKNADARAKAAQLLLTKYGQFIGSGTPTQQDLPAEENKLLIGIIAELPWAPPGNDYSKPSRQALFHHVQPEKLKFQYPVIDGSKPMTPEQINKLYEEATGKFLKDNADKLKIRHFVSK